MRSKDRSTPRRTAALGASLLWGALALASASVGSTGCGGSNVGSVGAVLALDRAREALVVREVPGEMTGASGGLRPGDVILSVDGNDVRGLDPKAVSALLRGEIGSEVSLTVERRGEIERLRIVRGPFKARGAASAKAPPSASAPPAGKEAP